MKHSFRNSNVGKAISDTVGDSDTFDPDFTPCTVGNNACRLSSGIEHLFVAMMAKAMVEYLAANSRSYSYQQVIHAPHTTVERRCGFDLSIGLVNHEPRFRMMHKLIYAKKPSDPWCDESWTWESREQKDNTVGQIEKLLSSYSNHPTLQPFLVIHLCYCLHDYRRMGESIGGTVIPGFEAKNRTVIVDLAPIKNVKGYQDKLKANSLSVRVERDLANGKISATLRGLNADFPLTVLDVPGLREKSLKIIPVKV